MIRRRVKKIVRLIGPYPYNPYLIFLFFFSLYFFRFIRIVGYLSPGEERWRAGALVILVSTVPALVFCGGAILLTRFRFWSNENTFFYILEVAFFQSLNLIYLPIINNFLKAQTGYADRTLITLSSNIFIASLVLVLIALALMHQAERRIIERLANATQLVNRLKTDRQQLVEADEKKREQTSRFLHDRVQSELMVIGIELKSISGKGSAEVNDVIEKAISRLETTRANDLRNLVEVLSPNFEVGGLSGALSILFEQFQSSMEISADIDTLSESLEQETLLGVFRIIEQSLLNSLVHGPANRVQVSVKSNSAGTTELIISDDGPGVAHDKASSGVGTAVINSWVGILNGKKAINTSPDHGYLLMVVFPV